MATLTQEQAGILVWMVETEVDSYMFASVMGPGPNHSLIDGMGGERFLSPGDLHELEALGLVRSPARTGMKSPTPAATCTSG
jgi:hypothetical protein